MTIHHVAQALLAVIAITCLGRLRFRDWGLNFDNARESLRLAAKFSLWFGLFIGISLILQIATGAAPIYGRPVTADHVIGGLFFMWIVSGISEEILFRGLFQTWFSRFWRGTITLGGVNVPTAGIVAAILFALVHINFSVRTLEITHFSPMQVTLSFMLGIFYAVAYYRTGSLLAPALAHNAANGIMETVNFTVAVAA